jgi:RNA polymerase sigma-70 factor (ECF subfamily)
MRFRRHLDERQFDALVRAHSPAVRAYARAMAPSVWAAEDAYQETFLRAWRYLDSYRATGSFEGWLLRICRNVLIDAARADRARNERFDVTAELPDTADPGTPGAAFELRAMIDGLPLPYREVVLLCGVLGYSYDDAATVLDIPIGTVRSRLYRARSLLSAHGRDQSAGRSPDRATG